MLIFFVAAISNIFIDFLFPTFIFLKFVFIFPPFILSIFSAFLFLIFLLLIAFIFPVFLILTVLLFTFLFFPFLFFLIPIFLSPVFIVLPLVFPLLWPTRFQFISYQNMLRGFECWQLSRGQKRQNFRTHFLVLQAKDGSGIPCKDYSYTSKFSLFYTFQRFFLLSSLPHIPSILIHHIPLQPLFYILAPPFLQLFPRLPHFIPPLFFLHQYFVRAIEIHQ